MTQESSNPFSLWLDMNKNAWDFWSKSVQGGAPAPEEKPPTPPDPFSAFTEGYKKLLSLNPFFPTPAEQQEKPTFAQSLYRQWEDGVRNFIGLIPNQSMKDSYQRFFDSYKFFNDLQNFWNSAFQKLPTDPSGWQEFFNPLAERYQALASNFLQPFTPAFMPDALKQVYDGSLEGLANVQKLVMELYQPIIEGSPELQALFVKAVQGDREAYIEFLRRGGEVYREVTGRLLSTPAMGSNRKLVEKTQKLVDNYIEYVIKASEYSVLFQNAVNSTMEKLVQHLIDLQGTGEYPKTFMEFYKLWSDFNEQAFLDLFATDGFERIMNETVTAGSKFKILYDDFLQDSFQSLPFPNRREMDAVEEEVYKLRKKVKALEKELRVAGEEASPAPRTPRTTRKAAS